MPFWALRRFMPAKLLKGPSLRLVQGGRDSFVEISEDGIELSRGAEIEKIAWPEIRSVLWSEPDYGYFWSAPYWTVSGQGTSIEIDDLTLSAGGDIVPWFVRKLPGFDPGVIRTAIDSDYFSKTGATYLRCWTRAEGRE